MDDVARLEFQKSLLQMADQLEAVTFEKRSKAFDSMVAKAYTLPDGQQAHAHRLNAHLVTELRIRGFRV